MTPALEEASRLLRLARRDRETFELLMPLSRASVAALGFHAQQSIEKALKAVCTLHGIEVRRTHDLAALGQAILDAGDALPVSLDELRVLNPFAVEFRYDDEIVSTMTRNELDARLAVILTWASRCIDEWLRES
ncbi:HEPN domain-containing protein [Aromatoleum anaerobium]|uniref:HEPN domain-containing protein n=1 Tax=Aromatoleum anaerobium TaxID=182180 RepID=A0ABX1PMI4_9RHOO|nr:HEPN domain-containing protein [Aromatoleum anaerobium]MCK0507085.1 HEPN domain-containing protein [Aromatoleum anaerobium]